MLTNDIRTTASHAGVGLAGRFGIAGGLLAVALGGAIAVIDSGLRYTQSGFETVIKTAQPMAEAAFEMEINTIGAGMAVVNYLHAPDPAHRQRFQKDRADFQRFIKRYRELATTGRQLDLALRMEACHDMYVGIGAILLDAKDRSDEERAAVMASLRELDRALETTIEMQPIADRSRQAVVAETVEKLERAIMGIPLLLADAKWRDANIERGITTAIQEIYSDLATLARVAPERSAAVQRLRAEFTAMAPRIEGLGRTQWEMAESLQRLIALRDEMDDILDDEIQILTGKNLDEAMDDVIQDVRYSRRILAAAFAILLVTLTAMFVYTARRVVRPIKRLAAFAAEIARGNFTASVEVTGAAEVGVLARAGAEMVGALQRANEKMKREAAERAKMQESLSRNERMAAIGQLSGGIAHDFNNMMMVMGGHADRAARHLGEPEVVEKSLEEIRAAIAKAANVVRRLSIFSGRRALDQKVFEIAQLRSEIDSLVQPTLGKQFTIECDFRDGGARVKCDPTELTQAVLNLVINASHASSPGSTIKIAVETAEFTPELAPKTRPPIKPGRHVVVSVADAGTGIPDSVIPHIFEPYFTTKPQGVGTGLGLASVYGFVAQSGGGIAFTTKMGQGTTFRIYLPITERPAEALATQDKSVPRGQGESILLVDDDAQVLELVQEILIELGYTVHAANGAFEAVELANDALIGIDLMLSDVVMPVMTGDEAYGIITERRPGLPVIFMSGDANRFGDVTLPANASFLEKPVNTAVLARALRSALAKREPETASAKAEQLATV